MKKNVLILLTAVLLINCKNKLTNPKSNNWSNAQWISLERLREYTDLGTIWEKKD
ncbi:MAG: hypothetical protein VW080_05630 [Flavobacteriaceae bacterium]